MAIKQAIGLKRGTVKLVDYSAEWPELFEKEKKIFAQTLGDLAVDIQHVGSTCIAGMIAKPVIDIDIGVKKLDDMAAVPPLMESIGYNWWKKISDDHWLFVKGPEEKRTHYAHLLIHDGEVWKEDLLFRDFLRAHTTWAEQYTKIKKELTDKYPNDRISYTKVKKRWIQKVVKVAKNND